MFKAVKRHRRVTKRDLISEADRAVIAQTATAAPDRIDDETRGNKLATSATGKIAGHLIRSRPCYICKQHYTQVDAFYHQLCPECAAFSHSKRDARTDLTGRRALLTGGRAKIGMYIALRLLRDGAHTTITTRFPKDAARRFAAMEDSGEWLHRLRIVGIDLRDPSQVMALTDSLNAAGPLDIIINNAAQTVRRSGNAYKPLVDAEDEALPRRTGARQRRPGAADVRPRPRQAPAGPRQHRHRSSRPGRRRHHVTGTLHRFGLPGAHRFRNSHRRRRAGPGSCHHQQLDPGGGRGGPAGDARGPALQRHGAVPAGQPAPRTP